MKIRLNKFLAGLGLASRRKVDTLMERGQIRVNDRRVKPGYKIDPGKDTVYAGKKLIHKPAAEKNYQDQLKKEYWAVYKPVGYVSTTNDPLNRPTVMRLVKSEARLYPVGRLDVDSEGLVLLTNDGDLTQKLTHPKHHVPKTYHVKVRGRISDRGFLVLRNGVKLKKVRTAPAEVEIIEKMENEDGQVLGYWLKIVLNQGLNKQVRRMMKAVNVEVIKLKRVAIGDLKLGEMKPKRVRLLTKPEIKALKHF